MTATGPFSSELIDELRELPQPHPSFLVSLLTREEPAIQQFRDQIGDWWANLDEEVRPAYADDLASIDNEDFFSVFTRLSLHEMMRHHDLQTVDHAGAGKPARVRVGDDGHEFDMGVHSYIPEAQMSASMSVFRHLVRKLNEIHHHYFFSVFLKQWLPYDFDARPIRRALEVWLDSLDDGSWHGKYAEYRDEKIHLEFSILDKLDHDRTDLVRFRIAPLRSPEVFKRIETGAVQLVAEAGARGDSERPYVAVVFSNEDLSVPDGYLMDFIYGKCDYSFNWTTHAGRTQRLKGMQKSWSTYGLFSDDRFDPVSALVIVDKEWDRDKVVFSLRVLHNPWAQNPLDPTAFADFAQFRVLEWDGDVAYLGWENENRARFRLP